VREYNEAVRVAYLNPNTKEQEAAVARIIEIPPRLLAWAEENRDDARALDALVHVVSQEMYLENNTSYPGRGDENLEAKAVATLLRDHVQSDRLAEACRRMSYGFSRDCEVFLRAVLESNRHRDVQGLACLRLAQFLNGRLKRLDLVRGNPQMAGRYEGLFGKDYLETLFQQDRGEAEMEVEALFVRATEKYADVKLPYAETVGVEAESELHEIRHLSVGKPALDIDGEDQDGLRFRLSDYRGRVVLLYFWSEY
jgi:hypothetical protein